MKNLLYVPMAHNPMKEMGIHGLMSAISGKDENEIKNNIIKLKKYEEFLSGYWDGIIKKINDYKKDKNIHK
ncbi:MAG: hypothetical protein PHU12_01605, partial [Candidatus Aenigmarchaeota archaeon]|nr:hypothetical protein [Candidatus Aenigmarchaeota archaeon]